MKRAKIALSAIAVFAVIGGAFAFKAKNSAVQIYTHAAGDAATKCTVPLTGYTDDRFLEPTIGTLLTTATTLPTLPCTTKTFYKIN